MIKQALDSRTGPTVPIQYEFRFRKADGTYCWLFDSTTACFNQNGELEYYFGSAYDITKRKWVEEQLRQKEEFFRLLTTRSPDHLLVIDRDLRYLLAVNPQLGLTETDMIGKTDYDILTKEEADKLTSIKTQILATGEPMQLTTSLLNAQGQPEYFDGWLVPKYNQADEIDGIFGYFRNVTGYKLIEEQLRQKNIEIEQFINHASHDLRSPLVTIQTFMGYLEQDISKADGNRIAKDVEFIKAATSRMENLLNEILEVARVGNSNILAETVLFQELVTDALDALAGQISASRTNVQVSADNPALYGDRRRLLQIWQNLLDNSLKYMGDQAAPNIEIGVEQKNGDHCFFVRDNGIGIAPENRDKVFGLLEKLDRSSPGIGMGLAMVKRIVELHDGKIWVESDGIGTGSCFYFTLPKATVHT